MKNAAVLAGEAAFAEVPETEQVHCKTIIALFRHTLELYEDFLIRNDVRIKVPGGGQLPRGVELAVLTAGAGVAMTLRGLTQPGEPVQDDLLEGAIGAVFSLAENEAQFDRVLANVRKGIARLREVDISKH